MGLFSIFLYIFTINCSPVENQNDLEVDFKVYVFGDSCCADIVLDESN